MGYVIYNRSAADTVHNRLAKYAGGYGAWDRGKKRANFAVLRETTMPPVLIGMAFISNPRELSRLKNNAFLKGFARKPAAPAEIFGLKKKPDPPPEPSDRQYASTSTEKSSVSQPIKGLWRIGSRKHRMQGQDRDGAVQHVAVKLGRSQDPMAQKSRAGTFLPGFLYGHEGGMCNRNKRT